MPMPSRVACLAAILVTSTALAQTQPAAPSVQRASCVLRLQVDDSRFGPVQQTAQTLLALFTSTALVDPSLRAALDLSPAEAASRVQIDVQPAGETAVTLTVLIRPDAAGAARPLAADAAAKLLAELARRGERAFNGPAVAGRPNDDALAALQKRRAEIDAKLAALRAEFAAANGFAGRRDLGLRVDLRGALNQQLDEQASELAVQNATVRSIEEQLPEITADKSPEAAPLRVKLTGLRIDARIAIAKANARVADLQRRLAQLQADAAATQPARTADVIQNEMNDLQAQRAHVDQQIAQLANARDATPQTPKLVVLDGGAE